MTISRKCLGCGRIKKLVARGLCGVCYMHFFRSQKLSKFRKLELRGVFFL